MSEMCRIGLLNLMPSAAVCATEAQWSGVMGGKIIPVKFDDDPREHDDSRSARVLKDYARISDVADTLDGIVVTGANLELDQHSRLLSFDHISYYSQLVEVVDWAQASTRLSIYSCLASHIALKRLFGLERTLSHHKIFGIFSHEVVRDDPLTQGLSETIKAPHSRWGNISATALEGCGVKVLAANKQAGWLLAHLEDTGRQTIFLQGHPEYGQFDLAREYERDETTDGRLPVGYFPDNNPSLQPDFSWLDDSNQLFRNIGHVVSSSSLATRV